MIMRKCIALLLAVVLLITFNGSTLAEVLKLPKALKTIDAEAFYQDDAIGTVDLPYGTTSIGSKAFAYSGISKIFIPETVSFIADDAFERTSNLVICSSNGTYAKEYAENHGLEWQDAGYHFSMEALEYQDEEIEEGDLYFGEFDDFGSDVQRSEELITAVTEYDQSVQELETLLCDFARELESNDFRCEDDVFQFKIDSFHYSIKGSLDDADYEIVSSSTIGGKTWLELNNAGKTKYVIVSETEIIITDTNDMSGYPYKIASGAGVKAPGAGNSGSYDPQDDNSVLDMLNRIKDWLSWGANAVDTINFTILNAVRSAQGMLDTAYSEYVLAVNGGDAIQIEAALVNFKKASNCLKQARKFAELWEKISKAADIYSISTALVDIAYDIGEYVSIKQIKDHDHPTEAESDDPYLNSIAEDLNRNYSNARNCIIAHATFKAMDILNSLISLISKSARFIPALAPNAAMAATGLALFKATVGGIIILCGKEMENQIDKYISIVNESDILLHTCIYGTVFDQNTRKPLQGVAVTNGIIADITDENGNYELHMNPGAYSVIFRKIGDYKDKNITGEVESKAFRRVDVFLNSRGATLYGTVTDQYTKQGISEAYVLCGDVIKKTDADGYYQFETPIGKQKISFFHVDHESPDDLELTLQKDQMLEINMTMKPYKEPTQEEEPVDPIDSTGDIPIDADHFPDPAFREYVKHWDKEGIRVPAEIPMPDGHQYIDKPDGKLSEDERAAVTGFGLSGSEYTSLTGFEYFPNLESISLTETSIQELDVRRHLMITSIHCARNMQLRSVNASGCQELTTVTCDSNLLTSLDLSDCSQLSYLQCSYNQTESLNLQGATNLTRAECYYNKITMMNIQGCALLEYFDCNNNLLTQLDFTGCASLKDLNCSFNQIKLLSKLEEAASIETLNCAHNKLRYLDFSGNEILKELNCAYNELILLNIDHCTALQDVKCANNSLQKLFASCCTELNSYFFQCFDGNQIVTLDISGCTSFTNIGIYNHEYLSTLNLSGCTALENFSCSYNDLLSTINLRGCTSLRTLECRNNDSLTVIDLEGCTALQELKCCDDPVLSIMDLRSCAALQTITCSDNPVLSVLDLSRCTALQTIICTDTQVSKLDVSGHRALTSIQCQGSKVQNINARDCSALTEILAYNTELADLDLSGCTSLEVLVCYQGKLSDLDVSDCGALQRLQCESNMLTSLSVSSLVHLNMLSCRDNQLTDLDVSRCTELVSLHCNKNQMESLDVSACPALYVLYCQENQLTELILNGCSALKYLHCEDNQLDSLNIHDCYPLVEFVHDDEVVIVQ